MSGILISSASVLTGFAGFRRVITIPFTGIADQDAVQTTVELTSANMTFANAESDGSDVHFKQGGVEIPYYRQAYDSGAETATFVLLVDYVALTDATVTMYYGDGHADASSWDDVFTKPQVDSSTLAVFRCDEGSGNLTDEMGDYTGTLVGSPSRGADSAFSTGHSLVLANTAHTVTFGDLLDTPPFDGCIMMRFKMGATPSTNARFFSKYTDAGPLYSGFDVRITASDEILFALYREWDGGVQLPENIALCTSSAVTWDTTDWHTIAVRWGDNGMSILLDGVQIGYLSRELGDPHTYASNLPWTSGTAAPLTLGANNLGTPEDSTNMAVDDIVVRSGYVPDDEIIAFHEHRNRPRIRQTDKFTVSASNPILDGSETWEEDAVAEPSVFNAGGSNRTMWYTAGWNSTGLGRATSTDGGATWTKDAGNPLIDDPGTSSACHSWVGDIDGTLYCFYATQPGISEHKRAHSTDNGDTWTYDTITLAAPSGCDQAGNSFVFKEGAIWYGCFEWGATGRDPRWSIFLYTSSDGSTWTLSQELTDLVPAYTSAGGPGGMWVKLINGTYHIWYHTVWPPVILHATSTDLLSWTISRDYVTVRRESFGFTYPDAIADPWIVEGATTDLYYEVQSNAEEIAKIGMLTYPGTLTQLVSDTLAPSVGSEV